MLNLQDCLDLADISEEEIVAIARHERIPPIAALELGHHLVQSPDGARKLRGFIVESVLSAQAGHRCRECEDFSRTLAAYLEKHPDCGESEPGERQTVLECLAISCCDQGEARTEDGDHRIGVVLEQIRNTKQKHDCCACIRRSMDLCDLLARKPVDSKAD